MSSEIILDSSAVSALFFRDPYSDRVEAALKKFDGFVTLDLAFVEVGNVAWKRTSLFKEDYATNSKALSAATEFIVSACRVIESREMLPEALEVAVKHGIPIYDALFLALASGTGTRLLTTDEKLHQKASGIQELKNLTLLPQADG
jgi:predicted nucleic acid-binding protein